MSQTGQGDSSSLWPLPLVSVPTVNTTSLNAPWHPMDVPFVPQGSTYFVSQRAPSPVAVREEDESFSALNGYLRTHLHAAAELRSRESRLRTIVLQAAEGGLLDAMKKALQLLMRMYKTHPAWPPPVDSRPPLDFHDDKFYSPLMYACEAGHVEVAEYLLKSGAMANYVGRHNPPERWQRTGKQQKGAGLTAMHMACIKGHESIIELLITQAREHSPTFLNDVVNARTIKDKWTPLMYAVKCGVVGVVKILLEYNKNILTTNAKGQTVLHIAASGSQLQCLKEIHSKLPPADVDQVQGNPYLKEDRKGRNVLHRVCSGPEGSVETLQWLLEAMPHLKTPDILNMGKNAPKGYTMLLLACDNNNVQMVRYLLSLQEVEVSACTADGKTGLHLAAIHDYPEVAQELIQHHIQLAAQDDKNGDTALHIALKKSSLDVAEVIRSSEGAEELKSIQNKANETPENVKVEQMIPMEIKRLGEEVVKRFLQALRKGKKKKMPRCNLIVLGEQRVGKTSLLRLLMGKKFLVLLEPTRGIDNEHVDVIDMKAICSSQWKEVRPEDQAKGHEKQFINSVAEELETSLSVKGKGGEKEEGSRPPADSATLIAEVERIVQYMEWVEQQSLEPPPPPPQPAPMAVSRGRGRGFVKKQAESTASKSFRFNPNAEPFVPKMKSAEVLPTEPKPRNPPKPPAVTEPKPKAEHTQPPQPPVPTRHAQPASSTQPTSTRQPVQPPTTLAKRNEQRSSNVSRRQGKLILSTAKQHPTDCEPVLQYNTLDFAGQKEYRPMHHCFIVRRALYLVVFNLQEVREALKRPDPDKENALEEISYWLHSIHAHVHKIHQEPHLKRVILVGTHRAPEGVQKVTEEDMRTIHKALEARFVESSDIANDLRYVLPNAKIMFAAVESSIDREDKTARQESGAQMVQEAIQKAWNELPFRKEEYPTTWLRFEAFLNRKRESYIMKLDVIQQAAKHYGIGEDDEKEIHDALGFFHDTGVIVYLRKLPLLYLQEKDKVVLDKFLLLDPTWLTRVMRNVMELKIGCGSTATNKEVLQLQKTGITSSSLLKECWKGICDDSMFHPLCLILQSFCLIFPISQNSSPPAQRSASSPATSQATAREQDTPSEVFTRSQSEGSPPSNEDTLYLIPSMLPPGDGSTENNITNKYKISFCFNFQGFLPVEVYHRLLCLMLREKKVKKASTSRDRFTSKYFQVKRVQSCNWMVQKIDSKLKVFVTDMSQRSLPPTMYISLLHTEYLRKICDEKESSLQGLEYIGGPDFTCPQCKWSEVISYVSYPDEQEATSDKIQCEECGYICNANVLLDPQFKENQQSTDKPTPEATQPTTAMPGDVRGNMGRVVNIHANSVVVGEPGSSINLSHPTEGPEHPKLLLTSHNELDNVGNMQMVMLQSKPGVVSNASTQQPTGLESGVNGSQALEQHQLIAHLDINDLQTVLEALVDVNQRWRRLGLALGLRQPTLGGITGSDYEDWKEKMLTKWLSKVDGCSPSWNVLVAALRNPTVGHSDVADTIAEKYL